MKPWVPRFHGNGFAQVYLDGQTRLHIWHPILERFKRVANAQIHDHRFWFDSTILLGELTNTDYEVQPGSEGAHGLWQQGPGHSDGKAGPLERIGRCDLRVRSTWKSGAGEMYSHGGPGRFHETHGTGLTVSLMRKTGVSPGYRAQIVCLNDEDEIDHAFENQPPADLLRDVVLDAMERLV